MLHSITYFTKYEEKSLALTKWLNQILDGKKRE